MNKTLITLALCFSLTVSSAQSISFGKIESPEKFQKYWGLDKENFEKYEEYMEMAGKYRHQNANPLQVLSVISNDAEDKEYFAQKAAKYEAEMVQREIQSSMMIAAAMDRYGYSNELANKVATLTGINANYVPQAVKSSWEKGDELIVVVDDTCLSTNCLNGFIPTLRAVPSHIPQKIIFKVNRTETNQATLTQQLAALMKALPNVTSSNYDKVEHGYLDGVKNQIVQVRDQKIIRKF